MLIAFADGEVPAREASRVSTHLLECWEYRARLSSLNETAGAVARIAANHPCGGADRAAHLRHRESRHRHQHARTERHLHRRQILRQEGTTSKRPGYWLRNARLWGSGPCLHPTGPSVPT
ncbi:MAG: hypothetical protein FJW40_26500 [Acidobacteria bacterium]|nr:hypothetical protein [Acidobacteriota bacterium]